MSVRHAKRQAFAAVFVVVLPMLAAADDAERPWMNPALDADQRAELVVAQMTRAEKQTLVFGYFGTDAPWKKYTIAREALEGSAGYVPGIARLGIPPQWIADAGIGVATQGGAKKKRERTALPSGMATAATWDTVIAQRAGAMIGAEARASGFNVLLAGGVNLVREPRNGRNFEYGGEDPLLAGRMVGAQIAGIQSRFIISTVKHFALNDQETDRNTVNAVIDKAQARMSDLLAFQIAMEVSDPGSVMCSYNKVWGEHSCENAFLLTDVLRKDWGWKGYVMSDWGATHSTAKAANAGLDQESGYPFDDKPYFGELMLKAVESGEVSEARLTEMARRIVRTMFAKGVVDHPVKIAPIDFDANGATSRQGAEQGAVLLKNQDGILPLKRSMRRIAIIGGHADKGVLAGGGSSLVYPVGGNAVPGLKPTSWPGPVMYYPSSPMKAIQALAPGAKVEFASGEDRKAAAALASRADVALVFATQWNGESFDSPLTLENDQDALVDAVASANPNTVVVLQTGGAVFMPWIDKVQGVLEAWYPGTSGGEAIANLLFGVVNPSGHLPISFPGDASQFARKALTETDAGKKTGEATYSEGATVGYKWFDAHQLTPLFPFGHGLTFTRFEYSDLTARVAEGRAVVKFKVRNTGKREGRAVPQLYVSPAAGGWEAPKRLAAFTNLPMIRGQASEIEMTLDPRLLAVFDADANEWRVAAGTYKILLGQSSADIVAETTLDLPEQRMPAGMRAGRDVETANITTR
ncbi:MAG TPA: beta-glucosidase [Steroidobacteraceae bacterium]|nr:beta-glucosidase [Steroidobacteraceae bacterium]